MNELSKAVCEACRPDAPLLSQAEIKSHLQLLSGWEIIEEENIQKLQRTFATQNYSNTMTFVNEVAALAESENHHPLMVVDFRQVTVLWWSHKIKGLHKNDFIMASKTSDLMSRRDVK